MSRQDEIDASAFGAVWRLADNLMGGSLITMDEADAFVAGTLGPDLARVTALLRETPGLHAELEALRDEFIQVQSGDIEDGVEEEGIEVNQQGPVERRMLCGQTVLVTPMDPRSPSTLSHLALLALTIKKCVLPLRDQAAAFQACRTREAAHQFFARFIHPVDGIWLSFCRALAAGKMEQPGREEVAAFVADVAARHADLGCGAAWRDAAMLMHDCAIAIYELRTLGSAPRVERPAAFLHQPSAVREMKDLLAETPPESSRGSQVMLPVVLCEPSGRKAHTAKLVMEICEGGSGALFPGPGMGLMPLDKEFKESLALACHEARRLGAWSDEHDVSWHLVPPDGVDVAIFAGGSLGFAALYGIIVLALKARVSRVSGALAANLVRISDPETVCFACALGGTMTDGIRAKITAALEDKGVAMLVCDPSAEGDIRSAHGAPDPHAAKTWLVASPRNHEEKLTVIVASGLEQAVEAVVVEQKIPPVFPWWRHAWRMACVKREWITKWLHEFIHGDNRENNRIALLLAPMGAGKTSYLASYFEDRIAAKDAPIAHFIDLRDPGSDDPKSFMRSLCAQVCRKHRLPAPTPPQEIRAWSSNDMLAAAQELVTSLMDARDKTGRPEVIFIDALDEAFGEGARFHLEGAGSLPDLLRAIDDLDPGWTSVRIIASSRDAAIEGTSHLANLKKGPLAILNLRDKRHRDSVKADLVDFFRKPLGGRRAAAEQAAIKADGNFLFARLYLKQKEADGIDELLDLCFNGGCISLAERCGLDPEIARVEMINSLGLLAVLRMPLTKSCLGELLGEARRDVLLDAVAAVPEFFEDGVLKDPDAPLRWLHSYIPEFILAAAQDGGGRPKLGDALARANAAAQRGSAFQAWHAEMASACLKWRTHSGDPAVYAVRHLLAHLRHARLWEDFAGAVTDVEFLRARLELPAGCRDLVKSLHRALKKGPRAAPMPVQRDLLKMIFDILLGINDADAKDWLHVFQELYNQLPPSYAAVQFFGAVESMLADAGDDRVWLRSSRREEMMRIAHTPLLHPCGVPSVTFSHERSRSGQWLVATAGVDRMVRIWKPFPPKMTKMIDPSAVRLPSDASRLGLPPTGLAFVKSARSNLVTLWNGIRFIQTDLKSEHRLPDALPPVEPAMTPVSELCDVSHVAADPTGTPHSLAVPLNCDIPLVAAGYSDGSVHICDADHPEAVVARLVVTNKFGVEHGSLLPLVNTYGCISISPDGRRVAVALPDQFIRIWSLDLDDYRNVRGDGMWKAVGHPMKGQIVCELAPPVDRRIDSLSWSPDGRILAVGGGYDRGIVELWDIDERTCTLFNAHQNSVWALAWLIDPLRAPAADANAAPASADAADSSRWILITGSYDRTFALWNYTSILTGRERDGERWKCAAYAGKDEIVFELTTRDAPAPLAVRAHQDVVLSIAVSPDNALIATAGGDHEANVWDVEDLLGVADDPASRDSRMPHGNVIHGGSISPDGNVLATASEDGSLRFWDMQSRPIAAPINFTAAVAAAQTVKFSPAGLSRALLVGTKRGGAFLVELDENYAETSRRHLPGRSVTSAAFNARTSAQQRVAVGHESGDVTIHGEGDATLVCPLKHTAPVRSLAFSPLAPVVATVGNDKVVIVWNYETGECLELLKCHQGRIKSAAFSPDGRWLVTGGRETIRLWSTATWSLEETINAHTNEIWTLEWSPCGRMLASGAKDKTVRLWNMNPESKGNRKIASLPCSNSVVAIWFSPDSRILHVADPGPERRKPACTTVDIRGRV